MATSINMIVINSVWIPLIITVGSFLLASITNGFEPTDQPNNPLSFIFTIIGVCAMVFSIFFYLVQIFIFLGEHVRFN